MQFHGHLQEAFSHFAIFSHCTSIDKKNTYTYVRTQTDVTKRITLLRIRAHCRVTTCQCQRYAFHCISMCHMCINETFNSDMILNNVIGSIHHYHNILFVIVCQSSIHNVFCVPYLLDQMPWLVLILPINFVQLLFKSGDYSSVMFISLSQSLR